MKPFFLLSCLLSVCSSAHAAGYICQCETKTIIISHRWSKDKKQNPTWPVAVTSCKSACTGQRPEGDCAEESKLHVFIEHNDGSSTRDTHCVLGKKVNPDDQDLENFKKGANFECTDDEGDDQYFKVVSESPTDSSVSTRDCDEETDFPAKPVAKSKKSSDAQKNKPKYSEEPKTSKSKTPNGVGTP